MSWNEASPGVYSRTLGGVEQAQASLIAAERPDPREPIKVHCIADFLAPYPTDEVTQAFKEAWQALRLLKCPDIATTFEGNMKLYKVPSSHKLEVWLNQTFVVSRTDTPVHTAIGDTYHKIDLLPVCYLVPRSAQDGTFEGTVFLLISHWRTEAGGAFKALDQLVDYAADLLEGASTKTALSKHRPGDEVSLLTPTLEDILMPNKQTTPESQARIDRHMSNYASHLPCIDFPSLGSLSAPRSHMKRNQRIYTSTSTTALIKACKFNAISLTAAIHAAYLGAIWSLAPPDHQSRSYACMMPAQVRTRLPASSPCRNQGCWSSANMLYLTSPAGEDFLTRARGLREQYKLADDPKWLYEDAREVVNRTLNPSGNATGDPSAMPWFTAIGLLDGVTLQPEHGSIKIERVTVWADNLGPGIVLGQWSFRGRLNLQIHWNVAYHSDEMISSCLDKMDEILKQDLGVEMEIEESKGADEEY